MVERRDAKQYTIFYSRTTPHTEAILCVCVCVCAYIPHHIVGANLWRRQNGAGFVVALHKMYGPQCFCASRAVAGWSVVWASAAATAAAASPRWRSPDATMEGRVVETRARAHIQEVYLVCSGRFACVRGFLCRSYTFGSEFTMLCIQISRKCTRYVQGAVYVWFFCVCVSVCCQEPVVAALYLAECWPRKWISVCVCVHLYK